MIRFIHTADIHFGMENYGKIDPKTGIHSRLLDFAQSLNLCIDRAIEEQVDLFLFSGDAYKTPHPSQTQQRLLFQCFMRLYQAHIPIVIIVGNHDNPLSFGKANALEIFGDLPIDGFYIISKPTSLVIQTKNGPIQIVGIPWPTRNSIAISDKHLYKSATEITHYISQAVNHIIQSYAQKLDPTIPAVLAGHLTVSSGIFSGSEKRAIYGTDPILLPSQLAIQPFDYVALGHLHRYQNLNPQGYPAVVYSGSIDRVDFGERKEEKGFCLVTIKEKNKATHEFIQIPTRPFIQIEINLTKDQPQTAQILAATKQYTIEGAIIKILYHLPPDGSDQVNIKAIQAACASAQHIVAILPIRVPIIRDRRIKAAKISMDFPTLLNTYFDTKPELKSRKKDLIDKALLLLHELENPESEQVP